MRSPRSLLIGLVLLGACQTSTTDPDATPTPVPRTTPGPSTECSAAKLTNKVTLQAEVDDPAQLMRTHIVEAAVSCDYEELERLARGTAGKVSNFTYAKGQPTQGSAVQPARFWRQQETDGEEPLATLVKLLNMKNFVTDQPVGDDEVRRTYTWPIAVDEGKTLEGDWKDLEDVYPAVEVSEWRSEGNYEGHRIGITDDGRWLFFTRD